MIKYLSQESLDKSSKEDMEILQPAKGNFETMIWQHKMQNSTQHNISVPDCVPEDMTVSPYYQSLLELGVPLCPIEYYDEYDPNDIPPDQVYVFIKIF